MLTRLEKYAELIRLQSTPSPIAREPLPRSAMLRDLSKNIALRIQWQRTLEHLAPASPRETAVC